MNRGAVQFRVPYIPPVKSVSPGVTAAQHLPATGRSVPSMTALDPWGSMRKYRVRE